jgi:MFS transporter, ACS family, D-galactonate transporter
MRLNERPTAGAWFITALIFLFMLVNFADKMVVGLAARPIMEELQLSPEAFGLIGSAFFFVFPFSAVVVGFITNHVQARHTLFLLAVFWSVLQFPMLGTVSFEVLVGCRILLGAAEGPASPVATHALYKWFPDSRRALPTAIVAQGAAVGVVVAVPLLNWIIVHHSWHWAFGALGVAGLLWSILWFLFGREGPLVDSPVATTVGKTVPYRLLLTCPSIVAVCCAGFASYWGLALGLTWLTSYLVDGLGYSQSVGGDLSVLPWLFGMVVVLGGGSMVQWLKVHGVSSRICRGLLPSLTVLLGGCILPFVGLTTMPALKLAIVIVGTAIGSTIYVVIPMVVSELTPHAQRAAMLAIVTSVTTLGGVMAPVVMGAIVQGGASRLAGYDRGFTVLAVMLLAGGLIGLLFIRPEADRRRLMSRLR